MKNLLFFCFLLTSMSSLQSQDTIHIDKKSEYFSETDTVGILSKKAKGIYYRAKYVREFIQFSEEGGIVEYCFYYDGQRFTRERKTMISLETDNKITIAEAGFYETWTYQKVKDNLYQITKQLGNIKEVGYANNLMPLEKNG